jgi:hypothetical protein
MTSATRTVRRKISYRSVIVSELHLQHRRASHLSPHPDDRELGGHRAQMALGYRAPVRSVETLLRCLRPRHNHGS